MSGLSQAIGMFSAEDRGRIMLAIKLYQMTQDKLEELEEDEKSGPEAEVQENVQMREEEETNAVTR